MTIHHLLAFRTYWTWPCSFYREPVNYLIDTPISPHNTFEMYNYSNERSWMEYNENLLKAVAVPEFLPYKNGGPVIHVICRLHNCNHAFSLNLSISICSYSNRVANILYVRWNLCIKVTFRPESFGLYI